MASRASGVWRPSRISSFGEPDSAGVSTSRNGRLPPLRRFIEWFDDDDGGREAFSSVRKTLATESLRDDVADDAGDADGDGFAMVVDVTRLRFADGSAEGSSASSCATSDANDPRRLS